MARSKDDTSDLKSEFKLYVERYYDLAPANGIDVTFDYQLVANPGYNRDRGPANVVAVRLHGAF